MFSAFCNFSLVSTRASRSSDRLLGQAEPRTDFALRHGRFGAVQRVEQIQHVGGHAAPRRDAVVGRVDACPRFVVPRQQTVNIGMLRIQSTLAQESGFRA